MLYVKSFAVGPYIFRYFDIYYVSSLLDFLISCYLANVFNPSIIISAKISSSFLDESYIFDIYCGFAEDGSKYGSLYYYIVRYIIVPFLSTI